jgi:hypothetical protein
MITTTDHLHMITKKIITVSGSCTDRCTDRVEPNPRSPQVNRPLEGLSAADSPRNLRR